MHDGPTLGQFVTICVLWVKFALFACSPLLLYRIAVPRARLLPSDALYGLLPPLWTYAWKELWPKGGLASFLLSCWVMVVVTIVATSVVAVFDRWDRHGWSRWAMHITLAAATLVVYHEVPAMGD